MEQQVVSKLGKEYIKAVLFNLFNLYAEYIVWTAYLTYMQSTLYEMPGWIKHKLESRLPGEI